MTRALTALATSVLLVKLAPISSLARSAPAAPGVDGLRTSLAVHAVGGLAILVCATLLAVYKPAGLTRFGAPLLGIGQGRTSRWASASYGVGVGAALLLILLAMVLAGNHGPGSHPPR